MKLLTAEDKRQLPELYSQDANPDPTVWVKLFAPWGEWTWYLTEYSDTAPDGTERLAFGLVHGFEDELGYISLDELQDILGPFALTIERDRYWTPKPLSEVQAMLAEGGRP